MKKFLFIIQGVFIAAAFASCGNNRNEEAKQTEADTHIEAGKENTATLTEAQIKAIGIETGTIENKQLTSSLKANGVLQVPNQNKASISSVYSGVVKSLLVQPGNSVTKDQIIATIANPEFIQSQEEYLSLAPKIVLAEQEYSRQKELNEGNAGALKNLQAADAQLKALKTRKAALASQIQLMGINPQSLTSDKLNSVLAIRSPIAGVVSDVVVKIGSFVSNGTSIADIVDNSHLHVDLFVYEKDLSKLRENQVIHFTLTNNPGKEYDAEIYSLGSSFEGESKAVTVHAQVNGNKTGLIDGMNITAVISLDKNTAPAVPSDAIVTQQGQDYIFIVTGESEKPEKMVTFEKVPVAKGTTDVGYTAITLLKQIPVETKVVTKGAFFVLAKMTNTGEHEE
ncbi:efflux RND transporter periplasmic adaptor subunit [Pinibacter aurantiacus]|uniref:efflux RND transporter periplasmic adaptor subunit n=1 Tax=Pinibacter aurantiacus TaxID=2851599 RepID=UPI001E338DC5|nr:efflux RND transporter periplasmic adaptor subunit [Pinibacter aurantiacus]